MMIQNKNNRRAPSPKLSLRSTWRGALTEPSTWAGVATIIGALATSGLAGLASPDVLGQIAAGAGLIALREVREAE